MLREEVNILVLDDVNTMRMQIKMLLKGFGFRKVTACENTTDALRFLDEDVYHLVLCDWHMELVSGLDFLRFLRDHPKHKEIGFIMVTAECTRERVLEAIQAGVDDYLVKPLTLEQVEGKVCGVLFKKKVLA